MRSVVVAIATVVLWWLLVFISGIVYGITILSVVLYAGLAIMIMLGGLTLQARRRVKS